MDESTRLREERLRRRWTLVDLTRATGISTADISQVERGRRPAFAGWKARLAKAFGMPVEDLFSDRSE